METAEFDIFSGAIDRDAVWVAVVEGLEAACAVMRQYALERRGKYFVYCMQTHRVVDSVDTTGREGKELSVSPTRSL
jgi:hypothetical protein